MPRDRREEILARLVEVCSALPGIVTCGRALDVVSESKRPAILIFDADEEAVVAATGSGRPSTGGSVIAMTPEVLLVLGETSEAIGPAMNAIRASLISAILSDSGLLDICGTNGGIRYEGLATGLSRGRNMEGEMGLVFAFRYPLILSEL